MAVYTDISESELIAFLGAYDIGELLSYKGVAEGSENSNFIMHTSGGTYLLTAGIVLTNDGTSGNPITVCNFPGEVPVLDGSAITQTGYQGVVLTLESSCGNRIVGLEITGAPESGLVIRGASHDNVIESLDVHHNGRLSEWEGKGICLYGEGSNNLFLNNDSRTAATIVIATTLLGLVCAWSRERTGSLAGPVLAHFAFNACSVIGGIAVFIFKGSLPTVRPS